MKALDEVWENQLEHNTSELPITEPRKAAEFLATNIMSKIG